MGMAATSNEMSGQRSSWRRKRWNHFALHALLSSPIWTNNFHKTYFSLGKRCLFGIVHPPPPPFPLPPLYNPHPREIVRRKSCRTEVVKALCCTYEFVSNCGEYGQFYEKSKLNELWARAECAWPHNVLNTECPPNGIPQIRALPFFGCPSPHFHFHSTKTTYNAYMQHQTRTNCVECGEYLKFNFPFSAYIIYIRTM